MERFDLCGGHSGRSHCAAGLHSISSFELVGKAHAGLMSNNSKSRGMIARSPGPKHLLVIPSGNGHSPLSSHSELVGSHRPARRIVMYLSNQSLLVIVIVGIIAGWLAGRVMEGGGFGLVGDLIVGLIGAFIGDWLLPRLGIHLGTGIVALIINAFIGAVVLLLILRLVGSRWGSRWGWRRRW